MTAASNRSSSSSLGREASSSSSPLETFSPTASHETEAPPPSRYVLPKDIDSAIRQLNDHDLDRLVAAALEERSLRRKLSAPEEIQRRRPAEAKAVSLPLGKLNAVKAAFKAGVTPARIAREFGISLSDVRNAIRL